MVSLTKDASAIVAATAVAESERFVNLLFRDMFSTGTVATRYRFTCGECAVSKATALRTLNHMINAH